MRENDRSGKFFSEDADLYTVTEITEAIRQNLESEFPSVSVIGEIANFKAHTSGHLYFSIRDERNLIRVVVFRRYVESIGFGPDNGMLVVVSGRISHYGGSGQTQLLAHGLVPAGKGEMELEFRRLLSKLAEEGLTAPERKRPIPPYPRKIAVITSPTGAVIRDIVETLRRRWPVAEVIHICVEVQGSQAPRSIMDAFEKANRIEDMDLVILARGGGSVEDLWTFNTEGVARAVASSIHPIITGIGHEIDITIADYVSDLKAATPTAAAELAVPLIDEVEKTIDENIVKLKRSYLRSSESRISMLRYLLRSSAFPALVHRLERAELKLSDNQGRLWGWWEVRRTAVLNTISKFPLKASRALERSIRISASSLSGVLERMSQRSPERRLSASREVLKHLSHVLTVYTAGAVGVRKRNVEGGMRALEGLYPLKVLQRGYSYCTTPDGNRIIGSIKAVDRGESMVVNFHDGGALCSVERKRKGRAWPKK